MIGRVSSGQAFPQPLLVQELTCSPLNSSIMRLRDPVPPRRPPSHFGPHHQPFFGIDSHRVHEPAVRMHSTIRDVTPTGSQNHQDRSRAAREPTSSALVYQTEEVKRDKKCRGFLS